MMTKTTHDTAPGSSTPGATRPPKPGYREHDGVTEWQECDTCALRLGAGITTKHDAAYYADDHDPSVCPKCGGLMCLPEAEVIGATCERCGRALSASETGLGWPVSVSDSDGQDATQDTQDVCPDCYGDDARCGCGALLRGDEDVSRCEACSE